MKIAPRISRRWPARRRASSPAGTSGRFGGSRPAYGALLLALAALAGCDQPLESVGLEVKHRIFAGFREEHRVAPGETFVIGDTEYTARIVGFLPDFVYDESTGTAASRSAVPNNPAVRIEVLENGKKIDEVWAFQGEGPPHYGRSSMLAFRVTGLAWKPGKEPAGAEGSDARAARGDSAGLRRIEPADSAGKQ
jgi:hypothetical protein